MKKLYGMIAALFVCAFAPLLMAPTGGESVDKIVRSIRAPGSSQTQLLFSDREHIYNVDHGLGVNAKAWPSNTWIARTPAARNRVTTGLSNDPDYSILVANGWYATESFLIFTIAAAADLQLGLSSTNSTNRRMACEIYQNVGTSTMFNRMHNNTGPTANDFPFDAPADGVYVFHCVGSMQVSSGPASCGIQWRNVVATGTGATLELGSWHRCSRID